MRGAGLAAALALAAASAVAPLAASAGTPAARAAGKGMLVLQTGSDWCVSGERLRKTFLSPEFRKATGDRWTLAVYDDMDAPTDEAKAANAPLERILVRTKRFPAVTCYAPGASPRFFAQIENVPGDVSAEKLARAVARQAAKKDAAEALFRKAAGAKESQAADFYGEGFDILAAMAGPFHFGDLTKGPCAWDREWSELRRIDGAGGFGWTEHFEMDDYRCVAMVQETTETKSTALLDRLRRVPDTHFTPMQRQTAKIMEYALSRQGTDAALSSANRTLLRDVLSMGRDTLWGQFAAGRLAMDGEKIESRGLPRAAVRKRPSGDPSAVRASYPIDQARNAISLLKPQSKPDEKQKLAIARHAVLRLVGKSGWDRASSRPGSGPFLKAFMNDRRWLEDFAWSGTFPANSVDPGAESGAGAGDGEAAFLALESLVFQDGGRWTPLSDGRFADNEGRRFMTALALDYPDKDEAWLADVLDAYRATALAGRLHKSAYSQDVWLWRFALHAGHGTADTDDMAAQQRHLDRFVNMPCREYGRTCWMIEYRLTNCFGDSVHGPLYYRPWEVAGEWPKRRYSQIVGGVCGELSKFGSATANAHGLPSTTVGQPGHCAYSRRIPGGSWELNYSVTGHSQMHLAFWNRHPWQYTVALEGTYAVDRARRTACERLLELSIIAESRGAKAADVEAFLRQACRTCPTHYGAWKRYGDWVAASGASLDTMRTWVKGCARGMKTGRQPLWDFLTPYFARLASEKGAQALADGLVEFAPLLRQSDAAIEEEADFKKVLGEWAAPLSGKRDLALKVLRAMLDAQYGTRDYFPQTLGWGGDVLMGTPSDAALYMDALAETIAAKAKSGAAGKPDFGPLILGAEKAGNLEAFRQIAALVERASPRRDVGKTYPESDFGGRLLSSEGMLVVSGTSRWDSPEKHPRCIDASPRGGSGFHTDRETAPWAEVVLPGPAEVYGVVVENGGGAQNAGRQPPLEVQVADGENGAWTTVATDGQVRDTYRFDLRSAPARTGKIRIRRTPVAKDEVWHLDKILVYGRKLY